jgi:hypothetical protein
MPLEAGGFPIYPDESDYRYPPEGVFVMTVLTKAAIAAAAIHLLNESGGLLGFYGIGDNHHVQLNTKTMRELAQATEQTPTVESYAAQSFGYVAEAKLTHAGVLFTALLSTGEAAEFGYVVPEEATADV